MEKVSLLIYFDELERYGNFMLQVAKKEQATVKNLLQCLQYHVKLAMDLKLENEHQNKLIIEEQKEKNILKDSLKSVRRLLDEEKIKQQRATKLINYMTKKLNMIKQVIFSEKVKYDKNDMELKNQFAFLMDSDSIYSEPFFNEEKGNLEFITSCSADELEISNNLKSPIRKNLIQNIDFAPSAPTMYDVYPPEKKVRTSWEPNKIEKTSIKKSDCIVNNEIIAEAVLSCSPHGEGLKVSSKLYRSGHVENDSFFNVSNCNNKELPHKSTSRRRSRSENRSFSKGHVRTASETDYKEIVPVRHLPPVGRIPSASKLPQRPHSFVTRHIVKPEQCQGCKQRIRFGKTAYRCIECRSLCHPDCKDQIPLPCVKSTPTPNCREFLGTIEDFAPPIRPRIPAFVIHCVRDIEERGLHEPGIYRISGSEKSVKELKERLLKGRGIPNFSDYEVHVVCSVLKDLLRSLTDPLVPNYLWSLFADASQISEKDDRVGSLYQAISQLPEPNRDTLAFLMAHLCRIANSDACKMPAKNLAIVFAPTIVGYSFPKGGDMSLMTQNQTKATAVMESLLKDINSDYWNQILTLPDDALLSMETCAYYQDTPPWARRVTRRKRFFQSPSIH